MPGELSTFSAKCALNMVLGKAADLTPPFTLYLALSTGPLTDSTILADIPEVTTAGYARQPVTWAGATVASPSVQANSGTITFGPFSTDMTAPVIYAGLVAPLTGIVGTFRAWWQLDAPMQVLSGQSLQISPGSLTLSLT